MPRTLIADRFNGEQYLGYGEIPPDVQHCNPTEDLTVLTALDGSHKTGARALIANDGREFPAELTKPQHSALIVDWTREHDHVQIATTGYEPSTQDVTGSQHWIQLDREGCNEIIATIRKARDAAFGRDQ